MYANTQQHELQLSSIKNNFSCQGTGRSLRRHNCMHFAHRPFSEYAKNLGVRKKCEHLEFRITDNSLYT